MSEAKMFVKKELFKFIKDVKENHGIELRIEMRVIDYLVLRNLTAKIAEEVITPVTKCINENPNAKVVGVTIAGATTWEHKDMLESTAYIKVAATS